MKRKTVQKAGAVSAAVVMMFSAGAAALPSLTEGLTVCAVSASAAKWSKAQDYSTNHIIMFKPAAAVVYDIRAFVRSEKNGDILSLKSQFFFGETALSAAFQANNNFCEKYDVYVRAKWC